jgi:hypothetical protein
MMLVNPVTLAPPSSSTGNSSAQRDQGTYQKLDPMRVPRGLMDVSWSATRVHSVGGTTRFKYAIVAMHSASIDGSPNAGPHTCSSSTMLWSCLAYRFRELHGRAVCEVEDRAAAKYRLAFMTLVAFTLSYSRHSSSLVPELHYTNTHLGI